MKKKYDVAIVGATGAVGRCMLSLLEERQFPVGRLFLLASERSAGKALSFRGELIKVTVLEQFDFSKVNIALFSAGSTVSSRYAPQAANTGCVVIDNTSQFRYDNNIPLVVPEVNAAEIAAYKNCGIIANPNCSTIQMVVVLKSIYDAVGIERINVATYQSVSGSGQKGIDALTDTTRAALEGAVTSSSMAFAKPIAFNVLPHIDVFLENGYTKEEMKMVWETKKIMQDDAIQVNPTAVRVPVYHGHAEAIHMETKEKITAKRARQLLSGASGVVVCDESDYPTPVTHAAGKDSVFVGRIREDITHPRGINLWVVGDNIRKGAALNSVQIAEIMADTYL